MIKTLALESKQEAVRIIEIVYIVASCYKDKTTLNQDAPVAVAKGNAIAKE
jgi:DNA mismatch repair protein MutS